MLSSINDDDTRLNFLIEHRFPFVSFGRSVPGLDFNYVDVDGAEGLCQAVEYLTAHGHQRIGAIAWPDDSPVGNDCQANEALRGIIRRESLMLILKDRPVSEQHIQEMMDRKNRYYLEYIRQITPADILPGALGLLSEIRQAGLKCAIGSASKNTCTVVEKLGIDHLVDAISDGYSVANPKPAPDLFLHAAHQLGLPSPE